MGCARHWRNRELRGTSLCSVKESPDFPVQPADNRVGALYLGIAPCAQHHIADIDVRKDAE